MAARKALRSFGSIRYSTVTMTGPRSGSISPAAMGAGQCREGERSSAAPSPASSATTARSRERPRPPRRAMVNGMPSASAMRPQVTLPALMAAEEDGQEDREPSGPHPFRQRHLRRDVEAREDGDPGGAGQKAHRGGGSSRLAMVARTMSTSAMPSVPAATSRSGPSNALSLGRNRAPPTAPAPTQPSRMP